MNRYTAVLVALLGCGGAVTSDKSSGDQGVPLDGRGGGLITFYSERDGNAEIYIMNADGSAQTNLTKNPSSDIAPDISPDGSRIVFVSNRDGNYEIYTMLTDGSNVSRLTSNRTEEAYPYYSADGSRVIYESKVDGNWDVFIMNADGSNQTRITSTPADEEWAHLSPDSRRIVYATGGFPNYDIYIMNADGTNPTPLVTQPDIQALPKWSHDGKIIAYNFGVLSSGTFTGDVHVVNPDGSNDRSVTNSEGKHVNENPYWSPDDSRIVFQSNRSGSFQIYVMDNNGGNQVRLTNHQGNDYWPSWGRK